MTCPYLEAKGWHMYVGYHKPDGTAGYACHGCGEYQRIFEFENATEKENNE